MKKIWTYDQDRLKKIFLDFDAKYKISQKRQKLNHYANIHPKKVFVVCFTIILLMFAIVFKNALTYRNEDDPVLKATSSNISNISNIFQMKSMIDRNNKKSFDDIASIAQQAKIFKNEVDSLLAIPHKNHNDSIQLYRKVKQLYFIAKTLKLHNEKN